MALTILKMAWSEVKDSKRTKHKRYHKSREENKMEVDPRRNEIVKTVACM
jgi:hypothetical protein